jgi:simple sugar transport system permease protein
MFVEDVLVGTIRSGTSVLFAAQGEVVAERSGVINLGTEGCMLTGALAGFAATASTGSPVIGVLAGAGAGAALAIVHAFVVITRRANQLASGLAVTFLGLGVTAILGRGYVDQSVHPLNRVPIPLLSDIPFLGNVLFNHDILTYAGLALGPLIWLFLYRTRWGLILRATGEHAEVAFAYGHSWVENVTVGRGFVAVALVIFAGWEPLKATLGSWVFGGALALQLQLQARGVSVSPFLLQMTPYVLTLAILAVASRGRAQRAPGEIRAVFGKAAA